MEQKNKTGTRPLRRVPKQTNKGPSATAQDPTVFDVARLAGVSIKTVSRVVNDEPNVRPATIERVNRAIRTLGYQPNPAARRLASYRSR